jgi:hypothetical protein
VILVGAADDNPTGPPDVADRTSLREELGVRDVSDVLESPRIELRSPDSAPVPTGTVLFITSVTGAE